MEARDAPDGVDPSDPAYVANPVTGERFLFHTPPTDPGTDSITLDIWAPPDMEPLAAHVHERQDETFAVKAGAITLSRAGEAERFAEGEETTVPAGTPHSWSPAGEAETHLTVTFDPALRTENFLRDLATLARRGQVSADGAPSLLRVAALYDAYGYDLLHLASPPLAVQKALFGVLAPVARLRGYRADPVEGTDTSG